MASCLLSLICTCYVTATYFLLAVSRNSQVDKSILYGATEIFTDENYDHKAYVSTLCLASADELIIRLDAKHGLG